MASSVKSNKTGLEYIFCIKKVLILIGYAIKLNHDKVCRLAGAQAKTQTCAVEEDVYGD